MSRWWVAVVDDHASVRTSLTRALNAYGIAAEAFGSAEEYLRQDIPVGRAVSSSIYSSPE